MKKFLKVLVLFLAILAFGQTIVAYVNQCENANEGNAPSAQRRNSPGA